MNPTLPSFAVSRGYCSQKSASFPSFHTIEEGVQILYHLLQKETLCRHDITHLTKVYHAIDQLESEAEIIPTQNSHTVLLKLSERIESMRKGKQVLAQDIITAYHLQQFKVSPIDQVCASLFNPVYFTVEKIQAIAKHLPFCDSEQAFDQDVMALIGNNHVADIQAILQTKKNQFGKYQETLEKLAILQQLKKQDPSHYPPYLEKILRGGFLHLYDHLIAMQALSTQEEREAAVKQLSFSSFAQIILEFREAMTLEMEKMIPLDSQNIVFLLGETGSGKSATFCYLRKDQMVLDGNSYRSSTDRNSLIGQNSKVSCTLFPNVAIDPNLVIVDFPGFNNTYSQVISLAIEITLRTLVQKYSPQVVLVASMTESGSKHIKLLGERLKRILGSLDHCTLGLTKYSQARDFSDMINREKRQEEALSSPSQEELKLQEEIRCLSNLVKKYPNLKGELNDKEKELARLQQAKCASQIDAISESKEALQISLAFQAKEEDFKIQTGIKSIISFKDLRDQKQLKKILNTLKAQSKIPPLPVHVALAPTDKTLLDSLFKNSLRDIFQSKDRLTASFSITCSQAIPKDQFLKNIQPFKQNILETSLINAILSTSHPEIGEFFHLKEMDFALVQKYDKKVIADCMSEYIDEVINGLLKIEKIIPEMAPYILLEQKEEIDSAWSSLRDYILTLSKGIPQDEELNIRIKAWGSLKKEHLKRLEKPKLGFSKWVDAVILAPLGTPYGIFDTLQEITLDKDSIAENANDLCQVIRASKDAIKVLKDIENIVKKQGELIQTFSLYPLSVDSTSSLKESLENQIDQVKMAYGEKEWDESVALITDQLKSNFSSIRPADSIIENILYALMSKQTTWEYLPPYFNETTFLTLIYALVTSQKNYQNTLRWFIPGWQKSSSKDLHVSNISSFFHVPSITEAEYQSFLKESKVFDQYDKNLTARLLLGDAIYRLWEQPSLTSENEEVLSFHRSQDKANILDAVRKNAWILEYSKSWLRIDEEFILSAIEVNSEAARFAEGFFKDTREFILAAIQKNGMMLKYTSDGFKNDEEIVLMAIKQNRCALEYGSDRLKDNSEFMLTAMKQDVAALLYGSDRLKDSSEFMLAAMKQDISALEYGSDRLKDSSEFMLTAMKQDVAALEYGSDRLKDSSEFMLAAIKQDVSALEYGSDRLKDSSEFMLAAMKQDISALEYGSDRLKDSSEFMLAAMKQDVSALEYGNDRLRDSSEFMLAAIEQGVSVLEYGSDRLKDSSEFMLAAIEQEVSVLEYGSDRLRDSSEFMLAAIQQDVSALEYGSDRLRDSSEFMLAAIEQDVSTLEYGSDRLKDSNEFMLAAMKQNISALEYGSDRLRDSSEFMLNALQNNKEALNYISNILKNDQKFIIAALKYNGAALQYANETLKNNREVVLAAVKKDIWAFRYASEGLKKDRETVLAAVKESGYSLQYASEGLKDDKEVVLAAVKRSGYSLEYASEKLKDDKDIILAAVKHTGYIFRYASDKLKNNREFILTVLKEGGDVVQYISETLKNDEEFVIAAVKQNGVALQCASEKLKDNKDFVLAAVKQNGYALQHASEKLKNDRELTLLAVKQNGYVLQYASELFKKDQEIVIAAVKQNKHALQYASELFKKDQEIVIAAVKESGWALQHASEALKNDREVVLTAVKHYGCALQYASETLKNEKEIVLAAVKQDKSALQYASETLKNDPEIIAATQ